MIEMSKLWNVAPSEDSARTLNRNRGGRYLMPKSWLVVPLASTYNITMVCSKVGLAYLTTAMWWRKLMFDTQSVNFYYRLTESNHPHAKIPADAASEQEFFFFFFLKRQPCHEQMIRHCQPPSENPSCQFSILKLYI